MEVDLQLVQQKLVFPSNRPAICKACLSHINSSQVNYRLFHWRISENKENSKIQHHRSSRVIMKEEAATSIKSFSKIKFLEITEIIRGTLEHMMMKKMKMNTLWLNKQKFRQKNKNIRTWGTLGRKRKRRRWVNFKRQQESVKMASSTVIPIYYQIKTTHTLRKTILKVLKRTWANKWV